MVYKYILILLGLILISFSRDITDWYEDFVINKQGASFPKVITSTRILISGLLMIAFGIYRLIEKV